MTQNLSRFTLPAVVVLCLAAWAATPALADRGGNPDAAAPATGPAESPPSISAGATTRPQGQSGGESEGDGPTGASGEKKLPPGGPGSYWPMYLMIGGLLLLFLLMGRKPRQEEKKRQEMLSNLKKGDKITTIGGMVGTIVEMREKDVTVKIDESANTRVKFARWAIRGVGAPDDEQQKKE